MTSPKNGARAESLFCKRHACHSSDTSITTPSFVVCKNEAQPGSRFCSIHPSCRAPNCNKPQFDKNNTDHIFCIAHTCAIQGCFNRKVGGDNRCKSHRTCYIPSCQQLVHPGLSICNQHKCMIESCPLQKTHGSIFCDSHLCGIGSCESPVSNPQLVSIPSSEHGQVRRQCLYCSAHECHEISCHKQANMVGGYCSNHGCTISDCRNPRSRESRAGKNCFHHYVESLRRSAEAIGREKEHHAALERQRREAEERCERERKERIQRQQSECAARAEAEKKKAKKEFDALRHENQKLKEADKARKKRKELEEKLNLLEHKKEMQKRLQDDTDTIGSNSVVDQPSLDGRYSIQRYNDHYTPMTPRTHYELSNHFYDAMYYSEDEIQSSYHFSPGVRHVRVNYRFANHL